MQKILYTRGKHHDSDETCNKCNIEYLLSPREQKPSTIVQWPIKLLNPLRRIMKWINPLSWSLPSYAKVLRTKQYTTGEPCRVCVSGESVIQLPATHVWDGDATMLKSCNMQTFVTFSLYLATSNKTSIQTVLMLPIYQGEAIAQVSLHMVLKPTSCSWLHN